MEGLVLSSEEAYMDVDTIASGDDSIDVENADRARLEGEVPLGFDHDLDDGAQPQLSGDARESLGFAPLLHLDPLGVVGRRGPNQGSYIDTDIRRTK